MTKQALETEDCPEAAYVVCTPGAKVTRINNDLKRRRDGDMVVDQKAIERLKVFLSEVSN
jgi:hypothetical protein